VVVDIAGRSEVLAMHPLISLIGYAAMLGTGLVILNACAEQRAWRKRQGKK
jgi:hypothetical protein